MKLFPFIYTVNDDLFMKNIISGAYLGSPDAHAVYMEYPLAWMLKSLYDFQAGIPWYGLGLLLFQLIGWTAAACRLLRGEKDAKRRFIKFFLVFLVYTAVGFYHMASLQFTVTAAVVGMAALVWFYTSDMDGTAGRALADNVGSILLAVLSFCIRRNVLLMLLPFAGMMWLRKWLDYRGSGNPADIWREKTVRFGALVLAAGVAVSLVYGWNSRAYGAPDWRYYHDFNDNATVLYDYYGWPDYEGNRELYEELGISYEAYEGARSAYLLSMDHSIDARAMERLAARSRQLYGQNHSVPERLGVAASVTVRRMVSDTDRPLNLVVIGLYGIVILSALLWKEKRIFLTLVCLWIGRSVSWFYIIYAGRYPTRITQSLLLAECGILLAVLLQEAWKGKSRSGVRKVCSGAAMVVAALFFLFLGGLSVVRFRHVENENNRRYSESRNLRELKDYCLDNSGNFYFVDTKSVTNDTEKVLSFGEEKFENYIVFGGWLSGSPVYSRKLALAGVEDAERDLLERDNLFVIFKNSDSCPMDYLVDYYRSKYGDFYIREVDRFGGNGETFSVYQLRNGSQGLGKT